MKTPRIGQTISHYDILERLGSGGMGVVYKARDKRLDRTVALKFLPPDLTRDLEAKARFKREAQAASALDHKNLCTIYEIDEVEAGGLFIAMSCYEGETIRGKIERGSLVVEEALDYAAQMAEGLARAHGAGIVHRDIKPANVLVTNDGEVKIVDFGLAKMAGQSQLTQTGTTLGTVAYMSPEQARGEAIDEGTDVWSLGVVMYEMLTGRRPFTGEFHHAVTYSIINEDPEPIRKRNPQITVELARIVERAMQKRLELRYRSAAELLDDLRAYQDSLRAAELGLPDIRTICHKMRQPKVAVPTFGVLIALILISVWFYDRQSKVRWAREVALPEVERLVATSWRDFTDAYTLGEQAERYIPDEPKLAELLARSSLHIDVLSEPPGAEVYMKEYDAPESEWKYVGTTPVESLRVPVGIFRWKMEKDGFGTVEAAAATWDIDVLGSDLLIPSHFVRALDEVDTLPQGMVRVTGAETPMGTLGDFFIDRYEVTNAQFKEFVESGGYRNPDFWRHDFIRDGDVLSWEEAMAEFVDQTGRPGPATWQAGDYPDGKDDHPVTGVSWYEAAAYAEFAGKSLPTEQHWGLARGEQTSLIRWPQLGGYATFAPFSNFSGDGPVAVGSMPGITSYGAYDMAGNVREWCWNETPQGRLFRGGAWDDNIYRFTQPAQAPPFDRSPKNGFRCVVYPDREEIPEAVFGTLRFAEPRNFYDEEPVSDALFEAYRAQFAYDDLPLNERLESRDDSADDWVHERISADAAYGGERLILHLFLPTNAAPPYQTVIYFPGSASLFQSSSENITQYYEFSVFLSFLLKGGRAVVYPVFKGTFERQDMAVAQVHAGDDSHRHVEYLIQWVKDFKRSIDFLETREDIDAGKLAYYGMSWGGLLGTIIPAVEDRLHASILAPGGLRSWRTQPEADPINYITRVTVPTLMLNGRYDTRLSLETSIRPMFDLLGTPEEHKVLKLYDTDHIPPRSEYIKEILAWLDRYLGPVH